MPVEASRADDERVLMALHLREAQGMAWAEIGARQGRSAGDPKAAAHPPLLRLRASGLGAALDGTLGPLWWKRRK